MIKINQTVIVEGKYDKIKLSSFIDANIIETNGFRIFKDKEKMNMIKAIADKSGILILTDADAAGFKIRNHLCGCIDKAKIKHAYIPEILGKEKRKIHPSKEGTLGVEGVSKEVLMGVLERAGVFDSDFAKSESKDKTPITKMDLFDDGLIGREESSILRQKLLLKMGFPRYISTNNMVLTLNQIMSLDEYRKIIDEIKNEA